MELSDRKLKISRVCALEYYCSANHWVAALALSAECYLSRAISASRILCDSNYSNAVLN